MLKNLHRYYSNPLSRAIGLTFIGMSLLFASWVTRIPDVQKALNLSESQLGWALLGLSSGALLMTFFSSSLIGKIGTAKAMFIGLIGMAASLFLPTISSTLLSLFVGLLIVGAFNGFLNVAMNTAAAELEKTLSYNIMSTCNAMFSTGAMIGAGIGSLLIRIGISPGAHLIGMGMAITLLAISLYSTYKKLPEGKIEKQSLAFPPKSLWVLTLICIFIIMGEGVVADWSALYLEKDFNTDPYIAGLGFAAYSATMALGRFMGDEIIPRFGEKRLMWLGSLIAAFGIGIAVITTHLWLAITGFALAGLGSSVVVPMVFSDAGNIPGLAPSKGIAIVSGLGIVGFLAGPPLIGFIAEHIGLAGGFGLIGTLCFVSFVLALARK